MYQPPPSIEYLPGTDTPAPFLMTAEEAVRYLRLDVDAAGQPRDMRDALNSLERLVKKHAIHPTRGIGNCNRFARAELERFIMAMTSEHLQLEQQEAA